MTDKKMEEAIAETISALSNAFMNTHDEKNADWLKSVLEEYPDYNIKNPEDFGSIVLLDIDTKVDLLARMALSNVDIDREKEHRLEFVYVNYYFISRHLKVIINDNKYDGWGCSTDKTRWLISTYTRFLVNGELPEVKERNYWHPRMMELSLWMSWIGSMYYLYYGDVDEYVAFKKQIEEKYKQLNEEGNNEV